jgi:hypothetical protein
MKHWTWKVEEFLKNHCVYKKEHIDGLGPRSQDCFDVPCLIGKAPMSLIKSEWMSGPVRFLELVGLHRVWQFATILEFKGKRLLIEVGVDRGALVFW